MPFRRAARRSGISTTAIVLLAGMFVAVAFGCTESQDCDCSQPEVEVNVANVANGLLASVTTGGSACTGVTPTCEVDGSTGCFAYGVVPTTAGDCVVTVTFRDGQSESRSFTFGNGETTCCGEMSGGGSFTVEPPDGAAVVLDASVDAEHD